MYPSVGKLHDIEPAMSDSADNSVKKGVLRSIDAQCLAYEESCKQGRLDAIGNFVANVPEEALSGLRLELAKIFIYYHCPTAPVSAGSSLVMLSEHIPDFDEPSQVMELIRTEFQRRIESDEYANLAEYRSVYPQFSQQLDAILTTELLNRYPIRIRLINEEFTTFSANLAGKLIAGRQDRGEAEPPAVVPMDELQSRLIVAARVDTKVARKHAAIEPYAANRVKISALSDRSATFINGEKLEFGNHLVSSTPLELLLGPQLVRLEPVAQTAK